MNIFCIVTPIKSHGIAVVVYSSPPCPPDLPNHRHLTNHCHHHHCHHRCFFLPNESKDIQKNLPLTTSKCIENLKNYFKVCIFHDEKYFNYFLDASSHLFKRVCPSVHPSVHPSIRPSVRPSVRPGCSSQMVKHVKKCDTFVQTKKCKIKLESCSNYILDLLTRQNQYE